MRIVDIIPKDISILIDLSPVEINDILFCLDNCVINYSSDEEEEQRKVTYFTDVFYKNLLDLKEKLADGD